MSKRKKKEQERICAQCGNEQIDENKDTNMMEWNPAIDMSQTYLESLYYGDVNSRRKQFNKCHLNQSNSHLYTQ